MKNKINESCSRVVKGPHHRLSVKAKRSVRNLRSFASLEPNWDTYGAGAPSTEIISRVVAFIRKADRYIRPLYFVAPGPNGEVVVEFERNDRELAVYFNLDGTMELVVDESSIFILKQDQEENCEDLLYFLLCLLTYHGR